MSFIEIARKTFDAIKSAARLLVDKEQKANKRAAVYLRVVSQNLTELATALSASDDGAINKGFARHKAYVDRADAILEKVLSPEQFQATRKALAKSLVQARRIRRTTRETPTWTKALRDFDLAIGEISGRADILEAGGGRDRWSPSPQATRTTIRATLAGLGCLVVVGVAYEGWKWTHPWSEQFSKIRMKEWPDGPNDALELHDASLAQTRSISSIFTGRSDLHFETKLVRPLCWLSGANGRVRPVLTAKFFFPSGKTEECEIRPFPETDCNCERNQPIDTSCAFTTPPSKVQFLIQATCQDGAPSPASDRCPAFEQTCK